MFIQTEQTPNPATLKFLPGREVLGAATADFRDPEGASASPLAERLFRIEGVTGVFLGSDFVTVTKAQDREWYLLKPAILGVIMEHFTAPDLGPWPDAPENPIRELGLIPGDVRRRREFPGRIATRQRVLGDRVCAVGRAGKLLSDRRGRPKLPKYCAMRSIAAQIG